MKKLGVQVLFFLLCITCGVSSIIFLKKGYMAAQEERKQQLESVIAEISEEQLKQEKQPEENEQFQENVQSKLSFGYDQGNKTVPKTGDLIEIIGWISLAVLSGMGICMIWKERRKRPRI